MSGAVGSIQTSTSRVASQASIPLGSSHQFPVPAGGLGVPLGELGGNPGLGRDGKPPSSGRPAGLHSLERHPKVLPLQSVSLTIYAAHRPPCGDSPAILLNCYFNSSFWYFLFQVSVHQILPASLRERLGIVCLDWLSSTQVRGLTRSASLRQMGKLRLRADT